MQLLCKQASLVLSCTLRPGSPEGLVPHPHPVPPGCSRHRHKGSSSVPGQPSDHCQTRRWPRCVELRRRARRGQAQGCQGWTESRSRKRERKRGRKEGKTSGSREREPSQGLRGLAWDHAAGSRASCHIFHVMAVKTFLCFQTPADALNQVSLWAAWIYMHNSACVPALTLARFLRSKKCWYFSSDFQQFVCLCV